MNLKQKLIEIRKEVEFLQKNQKGYGYKYVGEDSVLFAIKDKMNEHQVLLVPEVLNHDTREFEYTNAKNKDVKENIVKGDMVFTWHDAESEETLRVPFALYGQQQDASQAFGSGLTYSNRYFLLKFFQVATNENDPDNVVSKKREKEEKAPTQKEMEEQQKARWIAQLKKALNKEEYSEIYTDVLTNVFETLGVQTWNDLQLRDGQDFEKVSKLFKTKIQEELALKENK